MSSAGHSRLSVTCGDRWQRPGRNHPRTREARAWPLLPSCMVRRRTSPLKLERSSDHRIGRTLGGRGPWRPSTIRRYRICPRTFACALSFDETVKPPHAAGVGKHIRPQVLLRPPVVGKTIEMRNGERHRAPGQISQPVPLISQLATRFPSSDASKVPAFEAKGRKRWLKLTNI